ncbi:hypothetical protein TNCT6_01840 [Streptomyces sp. 6-11-2]|nr:hypothetical protein TNCT6_01840 [Streptomyces sp. 6-11-2]
MQCTHRIQRIRHEQWADGPQFTSGHDRGGSGVPDTEGLHAPARPVRVRVGGLPRKYAPPTATRPAERLGVDSGGYWRRQGRGACPRPATARPMRVSA